MQIPVRYKNVPFENVLDCVSSSQNTPNNRMHWNESMRGRQIWIEYPQVSEELAKVQVQVFRCGGPYYRKADSKTDAVCKHLVEGLPDHA